MAHQPESSIGLARWSSPRRQLYVPATYSHGFARDAPSLACEYPNASRHR
jgi:hypothetical protein